jgi:4-hydroxybutyrate CoA-transferase
MRYASQDEIVSALAHGRRAVASPGCGTPSTLLELLAIGASERSGVFLCSGMLLGDYPFLDAVRAGLLTYRTWHVMPPIRGLVADGSIGFHPVRASQVPTLLEHLQIDTALIRVSPPDRHGFCNLGPAVSYPILAVRQADLVIAEIDDTLPRVRGEGSIHESEIDLAIASAHPMPEYQRAVPDELSHAIAQHILPLLPESPTIQIGIGSIPEALLEELKANDIGDLRFAGMAIDGMADLHDAGLIDRHRLIPFPPIAAAELMGTRRLMDFAHENAALGMYSTKVGITASSLWEMERFVSINSAVEIDSLGQVSSEWARDKQISGVGGSIDFTEAAIGSKGGVRIIAMAATEVRGSTSKIVPVLGPGVPVTVPRHSVDYVVTEYGTAALGCATVAERVEALARIAHPDHRDGVRADMAVL